MAVWRNRPAVHITRIGDWSNAIELLKMVQSQQIDGKAVVTRTGALANFSRSGQDGCR